MSKAQALGWRFGLRVKAMRAWLEHRNGTKLSQKTMRDLKNPITIYIKALLFVMLGLFAATFLLLEQPEVKTGVALMLCVWAFCRAYYFAFYVIEKYVDSQYRYSGLMSFARYWFAARRKR